MLLKSTFARGKKYIASLQGCLRSELLPYSAQFPALSIHSIGFETLKS